MIYKKYYFIIIAFLFTYIFLHPVFQNFSTHLASRADGVFISWTIFTVSNYLAIGKNIYNLPIFYPFTSTLTYSDPFLSTALLTLPILSFTKNIVVLSNFHLITGTIFMFISSYLLALELKFSKVGSYFSTIFFTFSTIHLHYVVHLQSYLLAGIPLTYYFSIKWFNHKKWYWLMFAFVAFIYQTLNSPMSGFFIIFALAPLLIQILFTNESRELIKKNISLIIYYSALTIATIAIIYTPFFINANQFNYTRTIRDTAHFSHGIERIVNMDFIAVYLLIFILFLTRKKVINKTSFPLNSKIILSIITIGLFLMLGPVLKLNNQTIKIFQKIPIPLPYSILYFVIPGFKAFRDSSRWILLLNFGLSLLFGQLVTYSNINKNIKYLILLLFTIFLYQSSLKMIKLYPIPINPPKIYELVRLRPENTLVEFPIFTWSMNPYAYLENDRLMYQTFHKKILYNGVSGFAPPSREKQWDTIFWTDFPKSNVIDQLDIDGIELVIINFDIYNEMYSTNFEHSRFQSPSILELKKLVNLQTNLQLIQCIEEKCLYKIVK